MEGTIRELVVQRLDSKIKKLRSAKRKLSKRLLEDQKLNETIKQLVSIRRRLTLHNSTGAGSGHLPESAKRGNTRRARTNAQAEKAKTTV
jgi:hypothetical protein